MDGTSSYSQNDSIGDDEEDDNDDDDDDEVSSYQHSFDLHRFTLIDVLLLLLLKLLLSILSLFIAT